MDSKVYSPLLSFLSVKTLVLLLVLACNTCSGASPNLEDYPDYPSPDAPITAPPSGSGTGCRSGLSLGACASVLNGLLGLTVGNPPVQPCCSLIQGLVSLEAAACLCTAIQTNLLGINLSVPINLVLGLCGLQGSPGFQCS